MDLAQAEEVNVVNSKIELVTGAFLKAMESYKEKSGLQSAGE